MGDVPEVLVARVQLGLVDPLERDLAGAGVGERVLPGADVPLSPRDDDVEVGSQRRVRELEPDLVVALPGAPVREGVGADLDGDLDLALGEQWTRHRGAEQILAPVDRADLERRPDVLLDELLAQVLAEERGRPRREGLLLEAFEAALLADVSGHADDLGPVALLEPRHDHRGVEPARITEDDLHRLIPIERPGRYVKKEARGSEVRPLPAKAAGGPCAPNLRPRSPMRFRGASSAERARQGINMHSRCMTSTPCIRRAGTPDNAKVWKRLTGGPAYFSIRRGRSLRALPCARCARAAPGALPGLGR